MQETKFFPEQNLDKQKITNKVKFYSWPYSQPKIVNTIRASSKMGTLLGVITIPLVLSDSYQYNHLLFIDFMLFLSFIIIKAGIVPAIRRNQIKYTPSELRKINYYGLLITSMILYSSTIRVIISVVLYLLNHLKQTDIWTALFQFAKATVINVPINVVTLGAFLSILPIILLLYPRDIKIVDYHYNLLELQRSTYEVSGYKEEQKANIPLFPSHTPHYTDTDTATDTSPTTTTTNNRNINNANKNNQPKTKPKTKVKTTTVSVDIWETKISKRQRRD